MVVFSQNNYSFASKKAFKSAEALMVQGELDEALLLFKGVVTSEPGFSEAHLNISKIEFTKRNFKNSLEFGRKALKNNTVQHSIYSQIGKSFYMLKDYDSSSYYFKLANLYGANTANDFYLLAKSENSQSDFATSLEHIEKAISKDDSKAEYYFERANSYFGEGNIEKAKLEYETSLILNPNQPVINSKIASINLANNNPEEALLNINRGMENSTEDQKSDFLVLKGNYFKHVGEMENAEKAYDDAYNIDNNNPAALINQTFFIIKKGDYEKAIEKCSKAIEIDGTQSEAYFNRGIAYEMLKKTNEACSDWEEAFIMGSAKAEEFINSPICNE